MCLLINYYGQVPGTKLSVPRLLPPTKEVKTKWKEELDRIQQLHPITSIPGVKAAEWLITDILEYIYSNSFLITLMVCSPELLEVILKVDAFPVAGGSCLMLTVTLGNFGKGCKSSWLHFIAAIADCNDKDRSVVHQVLANNFSLVDQLVEAGEVFINTIGKAMAITFRFGGDDALLRVLTGLVRSSSCWCCLYCFWMRNAQDTCQVTSKRSTTLAIALAARSAKEQGGHEVEPMLKKVHWCSYKMCILHALMAMGRVFCHWLFNWLVLLQSKDIHAWDLASDWLTQLHIHINIKQPPVKGSWNVKGRSEFGDCL